MRVKRLTQEHNTIAQPGLEPGPLDPESCALTIRRPRYPRRKTYNALSQLNVELHIYSSFLLATLSRETIMGLDHWLIEQRTNGCEDES